ncbi:Lsr2 family protein [Nocardia sp. NPDC051900]|uniref:Lsr2 family protein n=1 Tax=Nocardia sp. NPDC051900 TaxID=3364326 RepID=UPI0037922C80
MALKVLLIDDFDKKSKATEKVTFGFDGITYEMDLSEVNADRLRGIFHEWIPFAHKTGGKRRARRRKGSDELSDKRVSQIRAWARQEGHPVSRRGPVSIEIINAYEAARTSTSPPFREIPRIIGPTETQK